MPDYIRRCVAEVLSSDETPFYTASGNSDIYLLDTDSDSSLILSGVFFDISWCPFMAKHGYRICILSGGQISNVVRKGQKGYELLGEAYMHRVMYRQVLNMPSIKIEAVNIL